MGNINQLSFEVANLIAAGEVVERPASVVKELLENAIDAGATFIDVEIRSGGVRLIRVVDNGCGMSAEDMPVALRRHATSKIRNAEDLAEIMTLGFRGEALAAISSVSDVTILSKEKNAAMGTLLTAQAGKVTEICEVGCADGTAVSVENLFYNVPARRKFLKKDMTEAMAVAAVCEKVALSRPDIAFRFVSDGTVKMETVGDGNTYNTLYALYGSDFAKKLLAVNGTANGVTVKGFVGRSDNARGNRNGQNTFLNGRYVKSKTVMAALEQAFTSYMAPERFPVSALYLEVSPQTVDVNVHPAKLEVKFSDERAVFEAVYYAVRAALEEAAFRPEMTLPTRTKTEEKGRTLLHSFPKSEVSLRKDQISLPFADTAEKTPTQSNEALPPYLRPNASEKPTVPRLTTLSPHQSNEILRHANDAFTVAATQAPAVTVGAVVIPEEIKQPAHGEESPRPTRAADTPAKVPESPDKSAEIDEADDTRPLPPYTLIGEAFHTYILVETDEGLLLIDKHAAHERVLFEELKADMKKSGSVASQSLLLPLTVTLDPEARAVFADNAAEFSDLGYEGMPTESGASLYAIPSLVDTADAAALLSEMCDALMEKGTSPAVSEEMRREKTLYQIACKGAIKGGRVYDAALLRYIVETVLRFPDITVCPHGRPIAIRLTKNELDRQFDRLK